ncbi:MAG: HAMP domain-containing histidine kinase [Deltaproteobacteria bacterium]|nr:HAMP domain-containing histidine kinase [Deltaproteobacteria bacterium]
MRTGINRKIIAMFFAGAAFAAVFLVWSVFTIDAVISDMKEMHVMARRIELADHLNVNIHKLIRLSGEYIIGSDKAKRNEFDSTLRAMGDTLGEMESLPPYAPWDERKEGVKTGAVAVSELVLDVVYSDAKPGSRQITDKLNDAVVLADSVASDLDRFDTEAVIENRSLEAKANRRAAGARKMLYVFAAIGLALVAVLYYQLRRRITLPIEELYSGAERITSGDYSKEVSVTTNDELEDLADGFNNMSSVIKEREEKLRSMLKVIDSINSELVAAGRYKGTFLANMSHELKTPLTHILGFTELISIDSSSKLSESGQKYLGNITKSGNELLGHIEKLLDVTRTYEGVSTELVEFDLKTLVSEVVVEAERAAAEKGQTFILNEVSGLDVIKADRAMLKHIFESLLDNAVKFTPKGGTVGLGIDRKHFEGVDTLIMTVTDTGPGIASDVRHALFTPFSGAETGFVRNYGGLGLGLALTKKFVDAHGGSIALESEDGTGAKFTVKIPMHLSR